MLANPFKTLSNTWVINLTVLVAFIFLFQWSVQPQNAGSLVQRLDGILYDVRLNSQLDESLEPGITPVVVIDIDEKSLQQYGRWPWSRETIQKMTGNENPNNARVMLLNEEREIIYFYDRGFAVAALNDVRDLL